MGTMTGQNLADQVAVLLQDEDNVRWTEPELTDWLNAGQREVVGMNPAAKTAVTALSLAEGTRQTLPTDAIQLIDVVRNMGTDGSSPGRVVRSLGRTELDEHRPDWHADGQAIDVKHFAHDARTPRTFFVHPPSDGSGHAEVVYSAHPVALTGLGDAIDLDDIYANALVNYAAYRAISKDADYTVNQQLADYYFKVFRGFVSHRAKVDGYADPGAGDAAPQQQDGVTRG